MTRYEQPSLECCKIYFKFMYIVYIVRSVTLLYRTSLYYWNTASNLRYCRSSVYDRQRTYETLNCHDFHISVCFRYKLLPPKMIFFLISIGPMTTRLSNQSHETGGSPSKQLSTQLRMFHRFSDDHKQKIDNNAGSRQCFNSTSLFYHV
jgi:hypothetical protein